MSILTFLVIEWILTIVPAVAFLVRFGWPGHREDSAMAWHVSSLTAVAVLETLGLLAAARHILLPLWVYAVIYGAGAAVVWWRLWLLVKSERKERSSTMNDGIFTGRFWKDAGERAVKSAAQAVAGVFLGDQVFDVWHADWKLAGGAALGAVVLSVVSSLISSRLGDSASASAVDVSR